MSTLGSIRLGVLPRFHRAFILFPEFRAQSEWAQNPIPRSFTVVLHGDLWQACLTYLRYGRCVPYVFTSRGL